MRGFTKQLVARHPAIQYPFFRASSALHQFAGIFQPAAGRTLRCDQPILLVVGAGRSGNTLLRKLLMEQGSIYIPPESYVWSAQIVAHLRAVSMPWEDRIALALGRLEYSAEFETFGVASLREFARDAASWPPAKRSLGQLILELYFWFAKEKGIDAAWVGDKTPMNLSRVGLIRKMFPNARYVYMERNAVDVVLSYRKSGLSNDVVDSARRWVEGRGAWRRFATTLPADRHLELTYEGLADDSEALVPEVLSFFGIPLRPQPISLADALGDVSVRAHHQRVRDGVGKPARYEVDKELTVSERSELKRVLGRISQEPGYEWL